MRCAATTCDGCCGLREDICNRLRPVVVALAEIFGNDVLDLTILGGCGERRFRLRRFWGVAASDNDYGMESRGGPCVAAVDRGDENSRVELSQFEYVLRMV